MKSDELWEDEPTAVREEKRDLGIVVFRLAEAHFAVDVSAVVEVTELKEITRLFRMPSHIRGVMNLRGRVIPVADLALLIGVPAHTASIGLLVRWKRREAIFAVDEVVTVEWINSQALVEVPSTTPESARRFFRGVHRADRPATILFVDRLIAGDSWMGRETEQERVSPAATGGRASRGAEQTTSANAS
jgi:purine-binding chemotaxis protein CheW